MKRPNLFGGALTGALISLPVIALTYLGMVIGSLPFVPFDIFDWMTRHLPGPFITLAIQTMVRIITRLHIGPTASTAKTAEQGIAIVQFLLASAVLGLIVTALIRGQPSRAVRYGLSGGGVGFLLSSLVEASLGFPEAGVFGSELWMAVLFFGAGWLMGRWGEIETRREAPSVSDKAEPDVNTARRRFLFWLGGGAAASILAAWGISRLRLPVAGAPVQAPTPVSPQGLIPVTTSGPAASPPATELAARFLPVPGTRSELTKTADFYRIDINIDVPTTDINTWRLVIDGLVDHPLSLTLDHIRSLPATSQVATLSCISNPVGGDLISTGEFTGVQFKRILDMAGLKPEGRFFNITAFDGFYESLGLQEATDPRTLLVYELNGEPLPPEHGYPLRIFIPNHYGMKQPKWIEHIAVTSNEGAGYWVDRGWSKLAVPKTTSAIDTASTANLDKQKQVIPIGGTAYAGERGISRVEIQMDGGLWQPAELRIPPLSSLSWVQWRFEAPYSPGRHVFRVRAYDNTGTLQDEREAPPEPSGATGLHTLSVDF